MKVNVEKELAGAGFESTYSRSWGNHHADLFTASTGLLTSQGSALGPKRNPYLFMLSLLCLGSWSRLNLPPEPTNMQKSEL